MSLIIGLGFGLAAAAALSFMWYMVERFRRELESRNFAAFEEGAAVCNIDDVAES